MWCKAVQGKFQRLLAGFNNFLPNTTMVSNLSIKGRSKTPLFITPTIKARCKIGWWCRMVQSRSTQTKSTESRNWSILEDDLLPHRNHLQLLENQIIIIPIILLTPNFTLIVYFMWPCQCHKCTHFPHLPCKCCFSLKSSCTALKLCT